MIDNNKITYPLFSAFLLYIVLFYLIFKILRYFALYITDQLSEFLMNTNFTVPFISG